ncbi:hypothetical protein Pmar_PMAR018429, partial [Perkinsus marinus ATCC 50983]
GSIVSPPPVNDIEIDDVEFGDQPARRTRKLDTKSDILLQLAVLAVVVVIAMGVYFAFVMVAKKKGKVGEAGGLKLPTVMQGKKQMID